MRNFTTSSTSWLFLRILLLFISSNSIDTVLGCCSFNDYVLSYNDNDDANDNNDYNNISHIADQIWHNYFYKTIHRGDNEATIGPLKLLGCTLYRDSTGIDIAGDSNSPETSSWTKWKSKFCTKGWTKWKSMFCSIDTTTTTEIATEGATESATENYSRIPTVKETWELFEEAYLYATSSMHEGDVKDNDVVDGENWEGDDDDDKNWEGDDDDYDDDDHVYDNENEDKDVIDNNKGQDNNKELLQKDEILMRRRGMQVPYEVRYDKSGKIGRSMYATEFIPKNKIIWLPSHTIAFMGDEIEVSYRRFIEYIHRKSLEKSIDYDWSCDALMWTYTSVHEFDGNQPALCIALDDGSLFNDSKGNGTAANVDGSYVIDVNNFKIPFGYEYGDNDENEDLIKDLFDSNTGRVVRHGYIHYQNRLRIANCQLLGVTADRDIQPGEEFRYEYGYYDDDDDYEYSEEFDDVYLDDVYLDDVYDDDGSLWR